MKINLLNICLIFLDLLSCNYSKTNSSENVVLLDLTEEYFNHISMDEFKTISAISSNIFNGEKTRIEGITENSFNQVITYSLSKVDNELVGNAYLRKKEVSQYMKNIDSTLTIFKKQRRKRPGSFIFKIMSEELNYLSNSNADVKTLIINSDLNENSFIDFSNTKVLEMIKDHPSDVEKILTDKYPLNKLCGIKVYIVYIPINRADGERFEIVSNFYHKLLSIHGAEVKVSGNLN